MSQNDFNLANQGFPSMRADMNSALQALASNSSGATAPATTYPYQWWYDDTSDILKIRNSDNDAWIDFATFNQTTDSWSFTSVDITGTLKVDNITDELGTGAPNFPNGIANGFLQKGAPIIITSSGTYAPSAGVRAIRRQVIGGGGAGGGVVGATSAAAAAGGGGAGGYCEDFITAVGASYTVTVGAGGTGSSGANGNNGGSSSVSGGGNPTLIGNGGTGANARSASTGVLNAPGGPGGTATGGLVNARGSRGKNGGTGFPIVFQPDGADGPFFGCAGGLGPTHSGTNDQRDDGSSGNGFGAGGSGASVTNASVNRAGGSGFVGVVIITEYE